MDDQTLRFVEVLGEYIRDSSSSQDQHDVQDALFVVGCAIIDIVDDLKLHREDDCKPFHWSVCRFCP